MARIIIATRGEESRHIQSVINRLLSEGHQVLIYRGASIGLPWWFKLAHSIVEYDFYFRRMKDQSDYYKQRALNDYPKWLQGIVGFLPRLDFLLWLYHPKLSDDARRIWSSFQPDAVIATSLMLLPTYEDFSIARKAKSYGIPLIGFAPTHDSLTTKTFIYPRPDILFAWNESHKDEAIKYHDILPDKIKMVGAYTHESWFKPQIPLRRDKFFKKYGFDEKKGFLLYVCSSPNIVGDEAIFVKKLAQDTGRQILVQFHPDRPKETYLKETDRVKFSQTDSYSNYLYCDEVWGVNTSAFLEAGLMGKKINAIGFPGLSLEAHQSLHFKSFMSVMEGKQTIREWLNIGDNPPSQLAVKIIKNYLNVV